MKKLKQLLSALLVFAMVLAMTACGESEPESKEINVFMLQPDVPLEGFLDSYRGTEGDMTANVQMGVSNPDMSVGDVLKNLNTKLMGNDGSDVIILDDINPEGYIESGRFADLSDILKANKDIPKAIGQSGAYKDGVYYLPLSISFIADNKTPRANIDFTSMDIFIKSVQSSGFKTGYFENLAAVWYRTEIEPKIEKEGRINEEDLKEYYENFRLLTKLTAKPQIVPDTGVFRASLAVHNLMVNPLHEFIGIRAGKYNVARDYITDMDTLQELCFMSEEGTVETQFAEADGKILYIPRCIIAVNENGKNKKAALEMVEYLISEEGQREMASADYIPVNKKVFKEEMEQSGESNVYGEYGHYMIPPFSQNSTEKILNAYENAKYQSHTDAYLMEIIMSGARDYINGEDTLDGTAEKAINKVNIYLAE